MYLVAEPGTFPALAELTGWVIPILDPVGAPWQQGWITEPLWYLRTYTWLLLSAPIILFALRRGRVMPFLLGLASLSLVAQLILGTRFWAVQDFVTYGFFLSAGAAFGLGKLVLSRTRLLVVGIGAAIGAVAFASYAAPLDGVVNNAHFLHLLVGTAWLALAHLALPALRTVGDGGLGRVFVGFVTKRSLSIYLWHAPVLGGTYIVASRLGVNRGLPQTLLVTVLAAGVTVLVTRVMGVIEDLAGSRSAWSVRSLVPDRGTMIGFLGVIGLCLFAVQLPVSNELTLPPTPSKAPEEATFATDETAAFLLAPETSSVQSAYADAIPQDSDAAARRDGQPVPQKPSQSTPRTTVPSVTTPFVPSAPWSISPLGAWGTLAPQADDALVAEVQRLVAEWVIAQKNPGIEIAVLQPGRMRLVTAIDANGMITTNADNVPLASVTKSFTATILLRAVEEGRISLHAPIRTLGRAPWFDVVEQVTLAQLLSHRSGLANYTATSAWERDWKQIDGWEPALRGVQESGLTFRPGARVEYSSTNFIVAGLLAEQIYGQPIETLIEHQLLDPLGLTRTTVGRPVPGAPGTGTGNMSAHITDVARWASAMWRDKSVMGAHANQLMAYTDPKALLGYGTFAWCPCRSVGGATIPAAMGTNGAEATIRYYSAIDTIIAMRVSSGVPAEIEGLINSILNLTR
jgi:CubicO group peptidase (beta-lactamase class C family)